MYQRISLRLAILAVGALLWMSSAALAQDALSGTLTTEKGLRILRLEGDAAARGYTHGYLLAEEIIASVEALVGPDGLIAAKQYEILRFVIAPKIDLVGYEAEIDAMLKGIRAKLDGKSQVIPSLKRDIAREDLILINAASDFSGLLCSSFTVFGKSFGGETFTARNLDYYGPSKLLDAQLLIVHTPTEDGLRPWVSIAWPGVIGCYTGTNDEGLSVLIHDTNGHKLKGKLNIAPRSLVLRTLIETADVEDVVESAKGVLSNRVLAMGANVHVSVPYVGGPAAWVFEIDGEASIQAGVHVREAQHDFPSADRIVCTNHMRQRRAAAGCQRYDFLSKAVQEASGALSVEKAKPWMEKVCFKKGEIFTVHTVYILPNQRKLAFGLGKDGVNGASVEPIMLSFDEIFGAADKDSDSK